jgi:hypothetical protein
MIIIHGVGTHTNGQEIPEFLLVMTLICIQ